MACTAEGIMARVRRIQAAEQSDPAREEIDRASLAAFIDASNKLQAKRFTNWVGVVGARPIDENPHRQLRRRFPYRVYAKTAAGDRGAVVHEYAEPIIIQDGEVYAFVFTGVGDDGHVEAEMKFVSALIVERVYGV